MYSAITDDIRISVFAEHLSGDSEPDRDVFAFRYTLQIENLSGHDVTLLERHWLISSGETTLAEVVGSGVLGEHPILSVGESFEYSSGTIISDPTGFMEGT